MDLKADIGIFGGSGFYEFLDNIREVEIDTPYGKPSDKISIGDYKGKKVAFLPRHGKEHSIPPHKIPYKANIYAMKELEVKSIISPCSCGSLNPKYAPGDFVVTDQFIDRTKGREDTYFEGPNVEHISSAQPYDEKLRKLTINTIKEIGITVHETGTVVVINGPRFSTKAESNWFRQIGGDIINMTQYPECYLALELKIPFVNIALVTDYDSGLEGRNDIKPVTMEDVLEVFNENVKNVKKVIYKIIEKI
ncbi:MAG: S-methyl-5'-thioadenosine phosphorylase [Eubacteriales bacterium]